MANIWLLKLKKKNYNEKVDIWSIGIITYTLLTRKSLFPNLDKNLIKKIILYKNFPFHDVYSENISSQSKEFLKKTLVIDYEKRYSAKELLKHEWIKNRLK